MRNLSGSETHRVSAGLGKGGQTAVGGFELFVGGAAILVGLALKEDVSQFRTALVVLFVGGLAVIDGANRVYNNEFSKDDASL